MFLGFPTYHCLSTSANKNINQYERPLEGSISYQSPVSCHQSPVSISSRQGSQSTSPLYSRLSNLSIVYLQSGAKLKYRKSQWFHFITHRRLPIISLEIIYVEKKGGTRGWYVRGGGGLVNLHMWLFMGRSRMNTFERRSRKMHGIDFSKQYEQYMLPWIYDPENR